MTDKMIMFIAGIAVGVTIVGALVLLVAERRINSPRGSYGRRSFNGNCVPMPPPTRRVRFDEGRAIRGNGNGGPSTPKPPIDPSGYKSMTFPDPAPERQHTNAFTGRPVEEDEL